MLFVQSVFYHLAVNLVKASFAMQYIRIFEVVRPVTWACYGLLGLVLGAAAWGVFGVVFLCDPIQSY
jgi:hypothetical protein